MISFSAFKWVPPFAQGLARDMRVRWALEEAGLDYHARLLMPEDRSSADYLTLQPFGQVPVFEDEGVRLFESGAIVLHIGESSETLLPADAAARARATTWLIAALNSIEIVVQQLAEIDLFFPDEDWAKLRRPIVEARVKQRLAMLAEWLGERDYLEDEFTAGDLMMTTVLRFLRHTDLAAQFPTLAAYQARCEARPAFQRALAAHMAPFGAH